MHDVRRKRAVHKASNFIKYYMYRPTFLFVYLIVGYACEFYI